MYCFAYYSDQGQDVLTALSNAKSWCYSYFNSTPGAGDETDQTVGGYVVSTTVGYTNISIEPAGYGVY